MSLDFARRMDKPFVFVKPGGDLEYAIKLFKKQTSSTQVDAKKHRFHLPPSEKRRVKDMRAATRNRRQAAKRAKFIKMKGKR